jgi:hypothetical protein
MLNFQIIGYRFKIYHYIKNKTNFIKICLLCFLFTFPNHSKADEKLNEFYKSLTQVAIHSSSQAGIASKCFMFEMSGIINTNNFWKQQFNKSLKFMSEPTYLVGIMEEYVKKYSPSYYNPMDFNAKEGKYTKKYFRKFKNIIKEADCIGKETSFSYLSIKQKQKQTMLSAAIMYGDFAKIDYKKANSYLQYFQEKEPLLFDFLMKGIKSR